MAGNLTETISTTLEGAISYTYDHVAVTKESILKAAGEYHLQFESWENYQKAAGLRVMDDIADRQILACKMQVSALGAAAGFGGFATIVPDTLQFLGLTLRMATGIAAAYGFDPHPSAIKGKVKVLVLQSYLNAHVGKKGVEALSLAATTKLLKNAAGSSSLLLKIIIAIARAIGVRLTRQGLLKSIPVVASGMNAGFNWYYARQIAQSVKAEFRQFRDDLRQGSYRGDPDFQELG